LEFAEDNRDDVILFDTNRDGNFNNTVNTAAGADAFSPGFCAGTAVSAASGNCRGNRQNEGYALRVGVDKHLGNGPFVAGLLIEGAKPGVEEFTTGFSTTPASYTFGREIDWSVNARARLGISPGNGRALLYGTGGVGYARIDHSFTTSNGANSFTPDNERDWQFGWQAGGGAEVMLTRNLGLGLEYLYSRYNDDDYTVAVGPGTAPATNPFLLESGGTDMRLSNDKFDFHALRATVNLRF
ncbi:MAG TPA: outer membrane beta-barrel protein, partial [Erythrobacter sp.]|nr:outer membrane beta-barrel protein [Erythrobacter sp.]